MGSTWVVVVMLGLAQGQKRCHLNLASARCQQLDLASDFASAALLCPTYKGTTSSLRAGTVLSLDGLVPSVWHNLGPWDALRSHIYLAWTELRMVSAFWDCVLLLYCLRIEAQRV